MDTIAAIATPRGNGGIGIIRISGPEAPQIAEKICGILPIPRTATFRNFRDPHQQILDQGLALFFPKPNSFTGEDVIELQGHGGMVVLDMILQATVDHGARLAKPGEFSERAFLNDRIDLAQAEAIADLIESNNRSAAKLAMRSLVGEFSQCVNEVALKTEAMRLFVEAAIDFPEEEIDFLAESDICEKISGCRELLVDLISKSDSGSLIREGLKVVLCGAPNVGKSSIMNRLSGRQRAIVSSEPGTTRDLIEDGIVLDGININLIDTAGFRDDPGEIEQQGIRLAENAVRNADLVLHIRDSSKLLGDDLLHFLDDTNRVLTVWNKIDLNEENEERERTENEVFVSAKTGAGIESLGSIIRKTAIGEQDESNLFLARQRHLESLQRALKHIDGAKYHTAIGMGELVAEELRSAHQALGEITGEVSSDDLLGKIFSSFCIGK
jgi:tRNA modification GTPase